jgi:hypothetical protein
MKKLIFLILAMIVIGTGVLFAVRIISGEDSWICQNGLWVKHGAPSKPKPVGVCGELKDFRGTIKSIEINSAQIQIIDGSIVIDLNLAEDAKLSDNGGTSISLADLYESFEVSGRGSIAGENKINVSELRVIKSPNIVLYGPKAEEEIGLPVEIKGIARVFENNLNVRVKDGQGNILVETFTTANSPDMGKYGAFKINLNYAEPKTETGTIEAFDYSAKDGSVENLTSVPIKFKKVESQVVKAFFSSSKKDPKTLYCDRTYATERRVAKTETPARAALEELLVGVYNDEAKNGFSTSINSGVKINKLVIEKGVAKVDFDATIETGVGGSCRVAAIKSQIVNTLKQFSTVKSVLISVEGRTEDILQP